jgi:hypothetical protein
MALMATDLSPAFIKGYGEHLPNPGTFDKFHVVWHANAAEGSTTALTWTR